MQGFPKALSVLSLSGYRSEMKGGMKADDWTNSKACSRFGYSQGSSCMYSAEWGFQRATEQKDERIYKTFRNDLRELTITTWLKELDVEIAVMESTGIYSNALFDAEICFWKTAICGCQCFQYVTSENLIIMQQIWFNSGLLKCRILWVLRFWDTKVLPSL